MNTKMRTSLQALKAPSKFGVSSPTEREKERMVTHSAGRRSMDAGMASSRSRSRRERKIQLQKTVERLRKKLRREENIHRALERAFTRPLGCLPRLPPYLPPQTVELLAEVAVLEEEVVRLEEQVIGFRQDLYQEAVYFSSRKNLLPPLSSSAANSPPSGPLAAKHPPPNQTKKAKKLPPPISRIRVRSEEEQEDCGAGPNMISEDLLRCLIGIFSGGCGGGSLEAAEALEPSISGEDDGIFGDQYRIFLKFRQRDTGPYKRFASVDAPLAAAAIAASPSVLFRKLRSLLRKLGSVDLRGLTHQEKLAFWVNVYNSCMMNAFLENGIPSTPQMVASVMQKATINVGGQRMNAISIEHFVLRLPHGSRSALKAGVDRQSGGGMLDWPEPLVTFALSCGSWSSPAVRVYTASKVEEELEVAKREYLQAAVGISAAADGGGMGIPKLLDWYLLDFAKDVDSLMDWICLQLPSGLRKEAVNCLEVNRRDPVDFIRIIPYDFTFRYLLDTSALTVLSSHDLGEKKRE